MQRMSGTELGLSKSEKATRCRSDRFLLGLLLDHVSDYVDPRGTFCTSCLSHRGMVRFG